MSSIEKLYQRNNYIIVEDKVIGMMNIGNAEILQIADSVAREKGLARDIVLSSMEQAIQVAGKRKYGHEHDIRAEIARNNGEVKLYRVLQVVENLEDNFTQILLADAQKIEPAIELGAEITESLPPIDLGRVAAQSAKQVIVQKVREAEREKQYEEFKGRVGEIINGIVKRIEFGNVIVELGNRAEAIIQREDSIRGELFKVNDRVKAYIKEVRRENRAPQILLSRAHEQMLVKLLEIEVPEVYDGVIVVKAVARDPGSKAKIAVHAPDHSTDPVGSCVGMRGSRIKAITEELAGEKIDVIEWSSDITQYVTRALSPADVSRVILNEETHKIEAIVAQDQLSLAIGRRGQNIRLAAKITGWNIDVMDEDQASKRRSEEFNSTSESFMAVLDVEETLAQLLTAEGFRNVEQLANIDAASIAEIDGVDEDIAAELHKRAVEFVEKRDGEIIAKLEQLGVEQELLDLLPVNAEAFLKLAEYGVKTLEDLGEIDVREFKALIPDSALSDEQIALLIAMGQEQEQEK